MAPKAKKKDTTFFDNLITKEPKITVLSDNPVSLADMKSDIFNFRYHLGPVYDIIRHEKTQMPLTIGINGKWGTGKTTAMQWLYDALEIWKQSSESKDKVKTRNIWFYPWKYHNKEEVWKGLIAEVIIKLLKVEPDVQNIKKGFELLLSFIGKSSLDSLELLKLDLKCFEINGKKIKKTLKSIVKNFHESNHPENNYLNHFEDTFKKWVNSSLGEKQRMVIFIDDLDRCMPDIALQVLEALKLYLKIDKLIFVIGMDRTVVEKAIEAYYKDRNIKDIKPKLYLDKMFQVEMELSPSKKEMDVYLDEQLQTVEYEQNLEYKDEQGSKKFYRLFKRLISKYGRRNPREVKRLINGSLIRGTGAERLEKEANNDGLVFEQGVQIFFIQKILAEQWNRTELVGDGSNGDDFFIEWSRIVRAHDGEEGFSCTVNKTTISRYMPENKEEKVGVIPNHNEKLANSMTDTISQFYISILDDPRYSDLLILLSDKELGQLMRIEFSAEIAEITQEVEPAIIAKDDTTIIRNTIAYKLKKEPKYLNYDSLIELNLTGKKISDITLLKQCKNLKQLYLNNTDISDISPLSQLTNLKVLYLSNTKISNIPMLENMTNLTELWLGNNQISYISSLSHLTNLTTLSLYNNQISDISHLARLTNLTKLDLRINQVSDISPLSELANLTQLQLSKTKIVDIEPLKSLTNLTFLDLNNTEVNDLTLIKGLNKLELLHASSTQIDNIYAIKKLTNLKFLGITNTKVGDLEPIKDLSKLESLFFSNTLVNNLEPVKGLKQLKVLSFKNTNVNDLEPLKELSNLEVLKIQNTQINSLEPIKGLNNLKELLLEGCKKITIEHISDLQKALPDCKIPALAMESILIGANWHLFFNPNKRPKSSKIMHFGENGAISDGQNDNESSWRIRSGFLELLNSDRQVYSRFYYDPDNNRFTHTNDPDTGSIRDQYMIPEKRSNKSVTVVPVNSEQHVP